MSIWQKAYVLLREYTEESWFECDLPLRIANRLYNDIEKSSDKIYERGSIEYFTSAICDDLMMLGRKLINEHKDQEIAKVADSDGGLPKHEEAN